MILRFAVAAFVALTVSPALAWNALGHRVVAEIAWQQLTPERRQEIVDTLKHHPRFAEDFLAKMPRDVASGDQEAQDRWIFWQAAVWPDVARGGPFDRPTWHYINRPTFLDGKKVRVNAQLSTTMRRTPVDKFNCIQAVGQAIATINDSDVGPDAKAVAYCWLFHLAGDMHQPMHSTALFCEYFPDGCRGGNSIRLSRGRNLHSLWDNLLGRDDRPNNVKRETALLKDRSELWEVDADADPENWITESHELAKSFAYDAAVLDAVRGATPGRPMPSVTLSDEYLQSAGERARARIVAAGLRLALLLQK